MALMLGKLHDALVAAAVDKNLAREAAEEVAGYENRLARIEATLTLHSWMLGAIIALLIAILGKMLLH